MWLGPLRFMVDTKGARLYYDVLMQDVNKPNWCHKRENNWTITLTGEQALKKVQRIGEIKLKWFQISPVHRILATNVVLTHTGVENDVACLFRRKERDAVEHIFWRCDNVRRFWEQLQTEVNEMVSFFGHDNYFRSDNTFDLIISLAIFLKYIFWLTNAR